MNAVCCHTRLHFNLNDDCKVLMLLKKSLKCIAEFHTLATSECAYEVSYSYVSILCWSRTLSGVQFKQSNLMLRK